MATAHYTILIPAAARNVGIAAHHHLTTGPIRGVRQATLQFGHPHDSLMVVGDETPELDSHIKQTATFIGDVANTPAIDVIKQGKNVAHWTLANPHYIAPQVQAPAAFSGPQTAPLPSAQPGPRQLV